MSGCKLQDKITIMRIVLDITEEIRGQFGGICYVNARAFCSGKRLNVKINMVDPKWVHMTMQSDGYYSTRAFTQFSANDYRNRKMMNQVLEHIASVFEKNTTNSEITSHYRERFA